MRGSLSKASSISARSFRETLDPSYKFSFSTLQFRGRLELLLWPPYMYVRYTPWKAPPRHASGYIRSLGGRESVYLLRLYVRAREHASACACGRYMPDNGRHPYGWRLGFAENNGANFPLSPSILVGILYCRARIYIYIYVQERYPHIHIYICIYVPIYTYVCVDRPSKCSVRRTYLYPSHTVSN